MISRSCFIVWISIMYEILVLAFRVFCTIELKHVDCNWVWNNLVLISALRSSPNCFPMWDNDCLKYANNFPTYCLPRSTNRALLFLRHHLSKMHCISNQVSTWHMLEQNTSGILTALLVSCADKEPLCCLLTCVKDTPKWRWHGR